MAGFLQQQFMPKSDVLRLVQLVTQILRNEPNVLYLEGPITIVGDIHGQLFDIAPIFKQGGEPGQTKFLFLGDYVDRGAWSMEVCLLAFALKVAFPNNVFLLRGNHESRPIVARYGFQQECLLKYDPQVFDYIMSAFDCLPLAAVIDQTFFCVHGGLSPKMRYVADLNSVQRFQEIPQFDNIMVDLVWSDPVENDTGALEADFIHNKLRNSGTIFGRNSLNTFLQTNNLKAVIRAHEVVFQGFRLQDWNNANDWQICTIFSAPNYTNHYKNLAAVISVHVC